MTKIEQLQALSQLCQRFGGRLSVISQRRFDQLFEDAHPCDLMGVSESPFTSAHGIHWRRKIIYTVEGREEIGSVIHEMGHVFADPHHPESGESNEWSWFGWEVAVARLISAVRVWSRQSSNYATDERGNEEWGGLTTKQRRTLVTERLAHARKIGVLDAEDRPRSVR